MPKEDDQAQKGPTAYQRAVAILRNRGSVIAPSYEVGTILVDGSPLTKKQILELAGVPDDRR